MGPKGTNIEADPGETAMRQKPQGGRRAQAGRQQYAEAPHVAEQDSGSPPRWKTETKNKRR